MIKGEFIASTILTLLCFSLLFGIKFSFFPLALSKLAIGYLVAMYILYTSRSKEFPVSRYFLPMLLVLMLVGVYSFIITSLKRYNDFGFVSRIIYLIHEPMLAGYLLSYYVVHIQKKDINALFLALRNAGLLQAVLTIPAYFNDGIRQFYDAILPNIGNIKVENLVQRVRGFSNLGGAWLSCMLCISFLCTLYEMERYRNRLLNVLTIILLLFAMVVTGRTGLMVSLLAFIVYIFRWLFIGKITKTFGYIIVTVGIGAFVLLQYYPELFDNVNQETIDWAFEAINSDQGVGATRSGDNLKEMIYMPSPANNFFWGSGLYLKGTYHNPRSDSGYMKTLLAIGLFAGLLFYSIYGFIFFKVLKSYYKRNKSIFFLAGFILTAAFLVEIKEPYLQSLGFTFVVFSIFFVANSEMKEPAPKDDIRTVEI